MIKLSFGIQVDMRGDGSFNPPIDSYLGTVTGIDGASSRAITARMANGATVTLFGRFDLSSEDALFDSKISGVEVREGNGDLVFGFRGFTPMSFNDLEQSPDALARAVALDAGDGYSIVGSTFDDVLIGLRGPDQLNGGAGDDVLRGGAGIDILIGGTGDDLLDGGIGADHMTGGVGDDAYVVGGRDDRIIELRNGGSDTVRSPIDWTLAPLLEHLVLTGSAAVDGTGNAAPNHLFGNAAANTLTGLAGADVLNGGAGGDRLLGGRGPDTYVVDSSRDRVIEHLDEGTDTVQSRVSFTLPANVEHLTLLGSAALGGTGNGLANQLRGNASANRLSGLGGDDVLRGNAGDDTLLGGNGHDLLSGGQGADRFVFSHFGLANADTITDFLSGTDDLFLDPAVFTALTAGALDPGQMRLATDVADGNDFLVYDLASDLLSYDASGNGSGPLQAIVTLDGLVASDIRVALPV